MTLTGGDRNDVTHLIPPLEAVAPIRGKRGRSLRRPKHLYADRGYDRANGTIVTVGNNADRQCEVDAWSGVQLP